MALLPIAVLAGEPIRVGPGVTSPRMVRKVDPEFISEARNAGVQGTVVFVIVVNEKGRTEDIAVLSPLQSLAPQFRHWTVYAVW
jgi:hypothetical protein